MFSIPPSLHHQSHTDSVDSDIYYMYNCTTIHIIANAAHAKNVCSTDVSATYQAASTLKTPQGVQGDLMGVGTVEMGCKYAPGHCQRHQEVHSHSVFMVFPWLPVAQIALG